MPLGKALYPHCLVPWKGLKAIGPLVACLQAACFLSGQVRYIQLYNHILLISTIPFYFFCKNLYGTAKKKRPCYLVGNLVATNWPIEKALHAIGYNQILTK